MRAIAKRTTAGGGKFNIMALGGWGFGWGWEPGAEN